MSYCDKANLSDYLANFSGQEPMKAVTCPFVQADGAGVGLAVFSVFVIAGIGFGLTVRVQHPGPILVAGILSAGVFAATLPAGAVNIFAIVLLFGIAVLGIYAYSRAQRSL